jgi:cell division protein FtsL
VTSAVVEHPRALDPPARRRIARERTVIGGAVAWIVVLGVLLGGIVAVNVLVLQLNVTLDQLGGERAELKADTARLRSHLSSTAASARIERQARALGLVEADPAQTTFVPLAGAAR